MGFLILFGRLFDLQIVRGDYFRDLAEGNRIRRIPISAPRGQILARGGEVLVGNKKVERKIILGNDGFEKVDAEEESDDTITEWERDYLLKDSLAHVTGYVGEISKEELGKIAGECPEKGPRRFGSITGRSGLEEIYDCKLKGIDGEELIEVDSLGRKIRTLGKKSAIPGEDIKVTIDLGLQTKVHELMKDKKGSVVITDSNGEVLALYSSPSYDPNIFVSGERGAINETLNNSNKPLLNRVIAGLFHPGSVYKPIVAIAALEEGKIDEDFRFTDKGEVTINTPYGSFSYKNWYFTQYGGVEGEVDVTSAIARSTDTFFYNLGEITGVDKLVSWSNQFGLDKPTGVDLPGEVAGLIPSPEWKVRVKEERWFLGNTYHMSIGQGDIALTPIGVNTAIGAIANNGKLCSPHLIREESKSKCKSLDIKSENIDLVKKGMLGACSKGGTGFTFFDFKEKSGVEVGCKTGTAEVEGNKDPHAWFVAFAPLNQPEIIATVLVENGGEGSRVAGPIAREIFNYWFKVQPSVTPSPTIKP